MVQINWKTTWWVNYHVSELWSKLHVSGDTNWRCPSQPLINGNIRKSHEYTKWWHFAVLYLSVKFFNQRNISKVSVNRKVASWSSFIGQAIRHGISFRISSIQGIHIGTWKIDQWRNHREMFSQWTLCWLLPKNSALLQQAKLLCIKPTYWEIQVHRLFNSPDRHFLASWLNWIHQCWFLSVRALSRAIAHRSILSAS